MRLPDLTPRPGGAPDLLAPFGAGPWSVLPAALAVAGAADGDPDIALELVRTAQPADGREDGYGILDLRLEGVYRLAERLAEARAADAAATVEPATLGRTWLRFAGPRDLELPGELTEPVGLGLTGLASARHVLRLSASAAALLRGLLAEGALGLRAVAQLEVPGIAPRLPLRVRADRAAARAGLAALGAGDRVAREDLLAALRADPRALDLGLTGDVDALDRESVAHVLCDLVVAELGRLEPARGEEPGPMIALVPAGGGVLERDLRHAFATVRPLVLELDPLAAMRAGAGGLGRAVRETTMPRFDAGVRPLRVIANLPGPRAGVLVLGASVAKEAAPPNRVHAARADAELVAPADEDRVDLRLAPGEEPDVDVEPYAVVRAARGVRRIQGPSRRERGAMVVLGAADFGLHFVRVSATPGLLALAEVRGVCRRGGAGQEVDVPFTLRATAPACSVAIPAGEDAQLLVELASVDGLGTIALDPAPAADVALDLSALTQFGPQRVPATCAFEDGAAIFALDVLPEASADDAPPQVVTFTPAQPRRTISWFASSPFRAGLRHRPHAAPGAAPAPWSAPHPPSVPLELVARASA